MRFKDLVIREYNKRKLAESRARRQAFERSLMVYRRSQARYELLPRQNALARLHQAARRGSVLARKQLQGIKSKAWQNLRKLRAGLAARALLRRAVRGRIASHYPDRYRKFYMKQHPARLFPKKRYYRPPMVFRPHKRQRS